MRTAPYLAPAVVGVLLPAALDYLIDRPTADRIRVGILRGFQSVVPFGKR